MTAYKVKFKFDYSVKYAADKRQQSITHDVLVVAETFAEAVAKLNTKYRYQSCVVLCAEVLGEGIA